MRGLLRRQKSPAPLNLGKHAQPNKRKDKKMTKYILKATSDNEVFYFVNSVCVTGQIKRAKKYDTEEEAQSEKHHFSSLFYDENPVITIEQTEA